MFAACQPGLEPLLRDELDALGLEATAVPGGASFSGGVRDALRACLWLGTASHVRVRLATFRCRALGELQRKAAELDWSSWLLPRTPLHLGARSRRSRVYHTGAIEERVLLAIGDRLRNTPPLADQEQVAAGACAVLAVRFEEDTCTISLDATATPLHRRGYRLDGRKAPLREDLAHALVLASGHRPDEEALLDPFCGSGTIAIEAAARALGLPPGRLLPAPFAGTARHDEATWQRLLAESKPRNATQPIAASDRDRGAIEATRNNAERAGVLSALTLTECSVTAQPWFAPAAAPERGVVATNPPFGRRVRGKGGSNELAPLYQSLGKRVLALGGGWRAAVLAHDVRLARRTALPLSAAFTTKHGGLSVTAMIAATQPANGGEPDAPS